MASAGKFSVLLNVNHKGHTKKKKKKNVGVDARTPISAITQKAPKPQQIPPATRNATAKKLTATPAKKIRPKITKTSPNSANVVENGATASSSNEHSLLDESEQWEEWKKKDEQLVDKMFQSDIEKAIALSRNDSQKQIDMQLAAWLASTENHKLSQEIMKKDTVHLKNGFQKSLAQNGPASSVPAVVAKQRPSKIVQQVHVEQKKVTENIKPKNKVESVKMKQAEASKQENHNAKSEDSEPQLTKAQKKRLKNKLKVAEVGFKENETNSVIAAAELPPVNSTKNVTQKTSNTEVRVSVPKENDDKNGLRRNELAAAPLVEDVISETEGKTILKQDLVPSADADLLEIAAKQPESHDNVLALQYKLEEKDLEIAGYRQREMKFALDIDKMKKANRKLSRVFAKGDMKQKAQLLMQIDELTNINDYLTKKIQDLHMLLEQEKSKSEIMQQELAKYRVGV